MKLSLQKKEVTLFKNACISISATAKTKNEDNSLNEELIRCKAEGVYNHVIKNGKIMSNADLTMTFL